MTKSAKRRPRPKDGDLSSLQTDPLLGGFPPSYHTAHHTTQTTTPPDDPPSIAQSFSGYKTYQQNQPKPAPGSHRESERLMDREGYFKQSKGVWNIQRKGGAWLYAPFYWDDWFHSLLNAPTRRIFFLLFILYLSFVTIYAACYLWISTSGNAPGDIVGGGCGMDITSLLEAFYFSLETMTTLGYGVSDYYFGDCYSPLILITCQVFTTITFDAVAIGVIFQRLSRVQKRARTIVFSDKAVIRRIRGRLFFMFQLSELRKHQLVEAHVRVYCVRHEREGLGVDAKATREQNGERFHVETAYFQTHNVRLQHPDDELGSLLLMALPNVVVHRIDEWSPLCAPPLWYDEKGRRHAWRGVAPPNVLHDDVVDDEDERDSDVDLAPQNPGQSVVAGFPELLQRACDKEADARVLLQTEYGLARREARLARNMGDSADLGRADSPRRMTRIKSDGDIILEEGKSAVGVEEPEETKPELRKDHSTVGFPPRKAGDSGKPAAQHSRDHPYSSQREEETPRERAKRKNDYNEQRELKAFLKDREAELVVLVEGIDVMTSATLQARHSYRWDDIAWNHTFKPCVSRKVKIVEGGEERSDGCVIDFSLFHDLIPVPSDCAATPLVSNVG